MVGAIIGAHGVRGDVRVKSFTAEPADIFNYAPLLSESGDTLIDPVQVRTAKDHFVVTPKTPMQKEEWDRLKSSKLYVSRKLLPDTGEDEYYIEDLVGLDVLAGGDAKIGRVKAVLNHGSADLIEIQMSDGSSSVLIPFTLEDVPTIDLGSRRLVVANLELWANQASVED